MRAVFYNPESANFDGAFQEEITGENNQLSSIFANYSASNTSNVGNESACWLLFGVFADSVDTVPLMKALFDKMHR